MRAFSPLVSSLRPPLTFIRRWVSRVIWTKWLLGFLFWEGTGDWKYTPWATLSETGWDFEKEFPQYKNDLDAFLLGLAIHIRKRDTLESSVEWAYHHLDAFDEFLNQE